MAVKTVVLHAILVCTRYLCERKWLSKLIYKHRIQCFCESKQWLKQIQLHKYWLWSKTVKLEHIQASLYVYKSNMLDRGEMGKNKDLSNFDFG